MPETHHCPHCGAPIRLDIESNPSPSTEKDFDLPAVPLLAPGSHDDNFLAAPFAGAIPRADPDRRPSPLAASGSKVFEPAPTLASASTFPAIDFGPTVANGPRPRAPKVKTDDETEGDVPGSRPGGWSTVLLASYASAVTLGLAWTLLRGRPPSPAEKPTTTTSAPAAESARQAGLSRKVRPPEPILDELHAKFGQALRVGDLEVTPVDVKRQAVAIQRSTSFGPGERKEGGKGALVLRLKVKNLSKDSAFAPLDQAYLRERGKEIVDTFVQTASGERVYPFPLAVDSEWSIVGQGFDELRPGEARVVAIASAPDAPPDSSGPFTWRVRLRTGINRTDVLDMAWPDKPPTKN